MELSEYLKQIVTDDQWVYENDCDLSARGITPDIVDEKLLLKVASKLHKQKERESFWNDLLDYLPEKSLTQNGSSIFRVGKDEFKIVRSGIVVTL